MARERGKYANAPHIGKVLPARRHAPMGDKNLQMKRDADQDENKVKSYLSDKKIVSGLDDLFQSKSDDANSVELSPQIQEYQQLEQKYIAVCQKMNENELSIVDLTEEEREAVKKYLKIQSETRVKSKYPLLELCPVEKQCFTFMKHLNPADFSFKGQKSAI